MPLDRLVEAYLLACRTEGMSSNTVRWYGQKLAAFLDHLRGSGVSPILSALVPDIVRAFVAFLQAEGLSGFTVRGYVQVLKGFATWLVEDGYLERHPLGKLALPRVPANVVKPLDDAEVAALLRAVNQRSYRGSRDLALLLLLLDTGMRLGEATGLVVGDAEEAIREGVLKVRGKGSRERYLPVGRAARNALRRYVHLHRPETSSQVLFVSFWGQALTAEGIRQVVRRVATRAGVAGVHPHRLRHTAAVTFLRAGGDVFALQRILGHSTLTMTRNYVTLTDTDIKAAHLRASPADRLYRQALR
jgi:site-specific recombinase XerD